MNTRPTSDRLRETLFNVLTAGDPAALEGSTWLDLFAGTGAVGIEALSRGALHVTFVDSSKAAAKTISENLRSLSIKEGVQLLESDVRSTLRQLKTSGALAGYIFIDPPYAAHELYFEVLTILSDFEAMNRNTVVIAEHDKRHDPGESFGDLCRCRKLLQGDSGLSFYRKA